MLCPQRRWRLLNLNMAMSIFRSSTFVKTMYMPNKICPNKFHCGHIRITPPFTSVTDRFIEQCSSDLPAVLLTQFESVRANQQLCLVSTCCRACRRRPNTMLRALCGVRTHRRDTPATGWPRRSSLEISGRTVWWRIALSTAHSTIKSISAWNMLTISWIMTILGPSALNM